MFLGRTFSQTSSGISEQLNSAVDREVQKLLNEGQQHATDILNRYIDKLHGLVKLLMEKERLNREEFESFMEDREYDPRRAEAFRFYQQDPGEIKPQSEPQEIPATKEEQSDETSADPSSETKDKGVSEKQTAEDDDPYHIRYPFNSDQNQ